jgi:hypothetical protein
MKSQIRNLVLAGDLQPSYRSGCNSDSKSILGFACERRFE